MRLKETYSIQRKLTGLVYEEIDRPSVECLTFLMMLSRKSACNMVLDVHLNILLPVLQLYISQLIQSETLKADQERVIVGL